MLSCAQLPPCCLALCPKTPRVDVSLRMWDNADSLHASRDDFVSGDGALPRTTGRACRAAACTTQPGLNSCIFILVFIIPIHQAELLLWQRAASFAHLRISPGQAKEVKMQRKADRVVCLLCTPRETSALPLPTGCLPLLPWSHQQQSRGVFG